MAARPLIVGNWKMNGLRSSAGELGKIIAGADKLGDIDVMVCPPATLIASFAATARGSAVAIGGQDCHPLAAGPYTGDISAEMLKDAGATAVIVGHSERRQYHAETDALVRAKALAAHRAGLLAIVCVGETRAEHDAGHAREVVRAQLVASLPDGADGLVVAYEPVWAIGSGLMPARRDIADMHAFVRQYLRARYGERGQALRILYGGSVKPSNAGELMSVENVDGTLVGGASLHGGEFLEIATICR